MLDRCSGHHQSMAAFSLFFPLPNKVQWPDYDDRSSVTTSPSSSSSTTCSVDCTLSLGTPSSRRAAAAESSAELTSNKHVAPYPFVSWDVASDRQSVYYCRQQQGGKPAGGGANKGAVGCAAHDAFADRRCANCGTASTPLWRNGPRGPKSLCNACGIRFKKEERRAAATAAMESGGGCCGYSAQYEYGAAVARASYGEGTFPCGGEGDADAANAPFLAWRRLNVVAAPAPAPAFAAAVWPERTSLFQYN